MSNDVLLTTRRGDVLELILNRPSRYNAIDAVLRDRLVDELDSAEGKGIRAILLSGNGAGFCSGADLKSLVVSRTAHETAQTMRLSTHRLMRAFLECPIPTVAAVHGTTAGIGLTLALGADVCVASSDAVFLPIFVTRGIVPDGGIAYLLPRMIGMARSKDLLMRGRAMEADEAIACGLIAERVPAVDLETHARRIADEFACLPTVTLSLTKQLLAQSFDLGSHDFLAAERAAQGLAASSDDAKEGRQAFLERRPPRFIGR